MPSAFDQLRENLEKLDPTDLTASAECRQQAQEVLATPSIDLPTRQAIADQLNSANRNLALETATGEDSY